MDAAAEPLDGRQAEIAVAGDRPQLLPEGYLAFQELVGRFRHDVPMGADMLAVEPAEVLRAARLIGQDVEDVVEALQAAQRVQGRQRAQALPTLPAVGPLFVRADVQALAESEPQEDFGGAAVIRKQAAYYVLSDRRRAFDPVGMVSNSLEAQFCYFLADDRFIDCMDNFLAEYGVRRREYLPAAQAQAVYLLPRSARAAGAILWDVDKISMSFDVVEGECVVWQQACSAGGGHVTAQIYFEEKAAAGVPFYVLEALIGKINLASMDEAGATVEYADRQATYTVSVSFLKGCVQDGLDLLCDIFGQCFEMSGDPGLYYRPIYLTGGGITEIRGVREYLSMRLGRPVEILAPQVPSYDRAAQSSVLSLLNMALERQREKSFLYKLFHGIGG